MNFRNSTILAVLAALPLFGMAACADPGVNIPEPGQGTGGPNASQPVTEPSVGDIGTTAPEGGAAARIGDREETVGKVSCTVLNGQWTASGSDEGGAKVAVTGSEDRGTVHSASVVLNDGTVASMGGGSGSATISWDGETFTVTGSGPVLDLNDLDSEDVAEPGETDFVITATCQA